MATLQDHIYSAWNDSDIDNNVKTMKSIIGDLSNITTILLTFLSDFNLYIENKAINSLNVNKSSKRKREIIENTPLDSNSISEPLNKKQKLLSIQSNENTNNNEYDKDDQKECDCESIESKSEPEQPQIQDVFVEFGAVELLLNINDSTIVNHMDMASSDCDSDDIDIETTKRLSNKLDALSQQFCYNDEIINLNINVETTKLKTKTKLKLKPKPKAKKKPNKFRFNSLSQRKEHGFDLNNKLHLKTAREQVIKNRITRLKKKDSEIFHLKSDELQTFISVDFMMNKINENEEKNNGDLLCDVCKHQMYVLSERHKNIPVTTMNISRFDHSEYHSITNIKTLECGMCNLLRGKHNMDDFIRKIGNVLAEPNSKESLRDLRIFQYKFNAHLLKLDLFNITTNATKNVVSCTETNNALIEHFKTIQSNGKIVLSQF